MIALMQAVRMYACGDGEDGEVVAMLRVGSLLMCTMQEEQEQIDAAQQVLVSD